MRTETSNTKELVDMQLIGHTCLSLNGELLLVWGGFNDSDDEENIEDQREFYNTDIWIYETLTGYWRRKKCSGECPPYMSSATSSLIGRKMYVFGGLKKLDKVTHWMNSLYCLDLETFVWRDLGMRALAEPTMPIKSDKCVSWSYDKKFYVFGGYGWSQVEHMLHLLDRQKDLQLAPDSRWPRFGWNNQLVEFDPRDNTWRWPSYKGKCPSARAAHSGALMGDKFYIFGGRDCKERLNDIYTFDMKKFEWDQITIDTDFVHPRPSRPIRHLLESTGDEVEPLELIDLDSNNGRQEDNDNVVNDEIVIDEEMIPESVTPSPSTSSPTARIHVINDPNDSCLSDEEEDGPYEYPRLSHLLERGSLSSTNSASARYDCETENLTRQSSQESRLTAQEQLVNNNDISSNINESDMSNNHDDTNQDNMNVELANEDDTPSENDDTKSPVPIGRSFSSFTPISNQDILLYGGVSSQDKNLDDCWLFNIERNHWTPLDLKNRNKPRLWHTGARTKNNEIVIIGGSCSDRVNEFCTEVFTISLEPKSLKRLALDSVAKSVRMQSIRKVKGLPSTILKLIKLRKQAVMMNMRGVQRTGN